MNLKDRVEKTRTNWEDIYTIIQNLPIELNFKSLLKHNFFGLLFPLHSILSVVPLKSLFVAKLFLPENTVWVVSESYL